MIKASPGYWDVDRCAWVVGADPTPARPAEHARERVGGDGEAAVPSPRDDVESTEPLAPLVPPFVPEAPAG